MKRYLTDSLLLLAAVLLVMLAVPEILTVLGSDAPVSQLAPELGLAVAQLIVAVAILIIGVVGLLRRTLQETASEPEPTKRLPLEDRNQRTLALADATEESPKPTKAQAHLTSTLLGRAVELISVIETAAEQTDAVNPALLAMVANDARHIGERAVDADLEEPERWTSLSIDLERAAIACLGASNTRDSPPEDGDGDPLAALIKAVYDSLRRASGYSLNVPSEEERRLIAKGRIAMIRENLKRLPLGDDSESRFS